MNSFKYVLELLHDHLITWVDKHDSSGDINIYRSLEFFFFLCAKDHASVAERYLSLDNEEFIQLL